MKLRTVAWMGLLAASFGLGLACKKESTSEKSDKSEKSDDDEKASTKKKGSTCPAVYHDFPDHDSGDEQTCTCPKDRSGSVWGVDVYTEDSDPCAAAIHAGVIDEGGGKITMKHFKGCKKYVGSKRNGIKSEPWGPYDGAFWFPEKSGDKAPKCPVDTNCPATFLDLPDIDSKTEVECNCAKDPSGTVYGTNIYTQDSNICAAALHAGAIDEHGGKVKVKAAKGCGKYLGSKSNGISSDGWGSYDASFYFPDHGSGTCTIPK